MGGQEIKVVAISSFMIYYDILYQIRGLYSFNLTKVRGGINE